MSTWVHQAGNFRLLGKYARDNTPITIVAAKDPSYKVDVISFSLCGDELRANVDEDGNRYGLKRGEMVGIDPEEIGDVIIRQSQ